MDIGIPMPEEPTTPVTPAVAKPDVTEHPISETEAKKYTGTGDFSMPTSPLDELVTADTSVTPPKAQSEAQQSVLPPAAPASTVATSVPETPKPEKLEDKAKEMLKELDKAVPPKPKKKSGTATKMALAAVLVVLMGAGGVVGMNLMNQSTENRSQAACKDSDTNNGCTVGAWSCQEDDNGNNTGFKCNCIDLSYPGCTRSVWNCTERNSNDCPGDDNGQPNIVVCGTDSTAAVYRDGNCLKAKSASQHFNIWTCDGMTDSSQGCQSNTWPSATRRDAYGTACLDSHPDTWCGVQQIDADGTTCFISNIGECAPPPTDAPQTSYSCTILNRDKPTPKIGETVTFNCSGTATGTTIDHYDFQYQVDGGPFQAIPSTDAVASGARATLKIEKKGNYKVQCRACESQDTSRCTAWGVAQ